MTFVTMQAYVDDDNYERGDVYCDEDLFWTFSAMNEKGELRSDQSNLYRLMTAKDKRFICEGFDGYVYPPRAVLPWEFLE